MPAYIIVKNAANRETRFKQSINDYASVSTRTDNGNTFH
jgi:hypothetical protein